MIDKDKKIEIEDKSHFDLLKWAIENLMEDLKKEWKGEWDNEWEICKFEGYTKEDFRITLSRLKNLAKTIKFKKEKRGNHE